MTPEPVSGAAATAFAGNDAELDHAIVQAIDSLNNQQADDCIAHCETALSHQPDCPEALVLLGLTSLSLGEPAHAITLIEKAYAADASCQPFAQALAVANARIGNVNDGLFYAKLATALPPHPRFPDLLPPAYENFLTHLEEAKPFLYRARAQSRLSKGQATAAIEAAAKQLTISPGDPNTLRILVKACTAAGSTERAIASGRALLHGDDIEPGDFTLLASALAAAGQWSEAAHVHRIACRTAPEDPVPASARLTHALSDPATTQSAMADLHQAWQNRFTAPPETLHTKPARNPNKPLRIGYFSNSFHGSDIAELIVPVLEAHAAGGVETYCYADGCRMDLVTEHIIDISTRWTDLTKVDDDTARAILNGDDLDVAVDLSGHGPNSRLLTLAGSTTLTTAGWFAYPHPCGLDHFIATDTFWPTTEPAPLTGDGISYLPEVLIPYRPPAIMPAVGDAPILTNGVITFGINGDLAHIGPATAASCQIVLTAHPTARLLIGNNRDLDDFAIQRCYNAFANVGLRDQVDIVDAASNFANPFEFYHHVDVALATTPTASIVETCHALWMGVPVLCPPTDRAAGRTAAATLVAAGLDHWVADSEATLLEIASNVCGDSAILAQTRADLRDRVARSPLADIAGASRALEQLYRTWVNTAP